MKHKENQRDKLVLGIGSIFRNEFPYIIEWIAFHRAVGIKKFFIADNNSDDGSSELLSALDAKGIICRLPFPHVPGEAPQLPAYAEILRLYKSEVDWMAFIDADEFLVPTDGAQTLQPLLQDIDKTTNVGAIVVNWAIYGSAHHRKQTSDLVIERFSLRAKQEWATNFHYKSIVKTRGVLQEGSNPHLFKLKRGFVAVHTNGTPAVDHERGGPGLSREVVWDRLRLNHYVVKSWSEFMHRKRSRGRATVAGGQRPESFFAGHDRNEVTDPMPGPLQAATKEEIKKIETSMDFRVVEKMKHKIIKRKKGAIDKIVIEGLVLNISGWLLTGDDKRVAGFSLILGREKFEISQFRRLERSDVLRHFPSADLDCGFSCEVPIFDLPAGATSVDLLAILAAGDDGDYSGVVLTRPVIWPRSELASMLASKPDVPTLPAMPAECRDYLISRLRQAKCYLEYGTGGSTIQAALIGIPNIIAIDSDAMWIRSVEKKLREVKPTTTPHLLSVYIGQTKELGLPKDQKEWKNYQKYALEPWEFCKRNSLYPDTILIDGRFRAACCLATLLFADAGSRILVDDYVERKNYHVVERYVPRSKTIGRMVEFIVPDALPRDEIWIALIRCLADVW